MENKDYWFLLKSHTYVAFQKEEILLYNTQNGNYITITNKDIISLVEEVYVPENLGVVHLKGELIRHEEFREIIMRLISLQIGELIDKESLQKKPIVLIPLLHLQKDVERLKGKKEISAFIGKNTLSYLLELNIYINNTCLNKCTYCHSYNKQFTCCTSSNVEKELPIQGIESLLKQIRHSGICRINILGGNIYQYAQLKKMVTMLESYKELLHVYIHYKNYVKNEHIHLLKHELIITFPIDETVFQKALCCLKEKEDTTWNFVVENEAQYSDCEEIVTKYEIKDYFIFPHFTGSNLDFFRENIYVEEEDILGKTVQMREIFRNQKLNSNNFGKLHVFPDGTIKANVNSTVLGNIKTDSILNIIYKEMLENTSWRKVRDQEPCDRCVCQYLCPPLSNYELTIGKTNLCHMKP